MCHDVQIALHITEPYMLIIVVIVYYDAFGRKVTLLAKQDGKRF